MEGLYWQQRSVSRHRRLVLWRTEVAGDPQSHTHRTVTKTKPKWHKQPKQSQLLLKQISNQCPEAGNQFQFKPTLDKLPVYYRAHHSGRDFPGQLLCISSLLLLRAGLCFNIIFHTLDH